MTAFSISERTDIYRRLRMVLVRHMIDLGQLSIHISHERVFFRGSLARLPGVEIKLTSEAVNAIFTELKRVPGVKEISVNLDNWSQPDGCGAWQTVENVCETLAPPSAMLPS